MDCPTFDDFPSAPCGSGRLYEVTRAAKLFAISIDAPLPDAPDGFFLYVFISRKRVGRWEWTADSRVIRQVMAAFRATTDGSYVPPQWEAPGGELAMIRPTIRDFLRHAMEHGRPDIGPEGAPPWVELYFPLDGFHP